MRSFRKENVNVLMGLWKTTTIRFIFNVGIAISVNSTWTGEPDHNPGKFNHFILKEIVSSLLKF